MANEEERYRMPRPARILRSLARRFAHTTFPVWERLGLHVVPVDFYEPVPNVHELGRRPWEQRSALPGVKIDADDQLDLLRRVSAFAPEYTALPAHPTADPFEFHLKNGEFERVDAEFLYGFLRLTKPRRVFEIGSGNSTLLSAAALERNRREGHESSLTACDPEPRRSLAGLRGLTRLIDVRVQDLSLDTFTELEAGDILFIDSSHVATIGSDVQFEYLEVIPRLKPGVIIHVHDVFMPDEYPEQWVRGRRRFWNEQYLLQAFLAFNETFEVLFAASWMRAYHADALREAFPGFAPARDRPASIWLRRVR